MVSRLRPTFSKCEITGVGSLKNANVALCYYIFYNKKPQDDINFCKTFKNICNVIKLWRMRHLSLEGKTTLHKKCNFL